MGFYSTFKKSCYFVYFLTTIFQRNRVPESFIISTKQVCLKAIPLKQGLWFNESVVRAKKNCAVVLFCRELATQIYRVTGAPCARCSNFLDVRGLVFVCRFAVRVLRGCIVRGLIGLILRHN